MSLLATSPVTSGIGGRSQTDLGNGPVSGTAGPRTRGRVMEAGALEARGQDTWGTHGGGSVTTVDEETVPGESSLLVICFLHE